MQLECVGSEDFYFSDSEWVLREAPVGEIAMHLGKYQFVTDVIVADDSSQFALVHIMGIDVFRRRHSHRWHGIFQLPEFWLTLALSLALLYSLHRDWKGLADAGPPKGEAP